MFAVRKKTLGASSWLIPTTLSGSFLITCLIIVLISPWPLGHDEAVYFLNSLDPEGNGNQAADSWMALRAPMVPRIWEFLWYLGVPKSVGILRTLSLGITVMSGVLASRLITKIFKIDRASASWTVVGFLAFPASAYTATTLLIDGYSLFFMLLGVWSFDRLARSSLRFRLPLASLLSALFVAFAQLSRFGAPLLYAVLFLPVLLHVLLQDVNPVTTKQLIPSVLRFLSVVSLHSALLVGIYSWGLYSVDGATPSEANQEALRGKGANWSTLLESFKYWLNRDFFGNWASTTVILSLGFTCLLALSVAVVLVWRLFFTDRPLEILKSMNTPRAMLVSGTVIVLAIFLGVSYAVKMVWTWYLAGGAVGLALVFGSISEYSKMARGASRFTINTVLVVLAVIFLISNIALIQSEHNRNVRNFGGLEEISSSFRDEASCFIFSSYRPQIAAYSGCVVRSLDADVFDDVGDDEPIGEERFLALISNRSDELRAEFGCIGTHFVYNGKRQADFRFVRDLNWYVDTLLTTNGRDNFLASVGCS